VTPSGPMRRLERMGVGEDGSHLKIQEMLRDDANTRNNGRCKVFVNGVRVGNKEPLSTQMSRRSCGFPPQLGKA